MGPWDFLGLYRIICSSHSPSPLTILSPNTSNFSHWEKLTGQQFPNTNASSFNGKLGLGWSPGFTGPCFEVRSGLLHTSLQGSEVSSPFWASLGPHFFLHYLVSSPVCKQAKDGTKGPANFCISQEAFLTVPGSSLAAPSYQWEAFWASHFIHRSIYPVYK